MYIEAAISPSDKVLHDVKLPFRDSKFPSDQIASKSRSWKTEEEIVAYIEASINPSAKVLHDVKLPVLGFNQTRQCDVVIKYGNDPRSVVFIVEVQKRGRKVEINTFHGWVKKMEDVGANGLICVSEAGFPKSIIDQVENRIGPKVRLVTFHPNQSHLDWVGLDYNLLLGVYEVNIQSMRHPNLWDRNSSTPLTIDFQGRVVSTTGDQRTAFTIGNLVQKVVMSIDPVSKMPMGTAGKAININLNIPSLDDMPIYLHAVEGVFRIRAWKFNVNIRRIDTAIPLILSKWNYIQEFHNNCLAWVSTTVLEIPGIPQEVRSVCVPNGEGNFKTTMQVKPLPVDKLARTITIDQWLTENHVTRTPPPGICPPWEKLA